MNAYELIKKLLKVIEFLAQSKDTPWQDRHEGLTPTQIAYWQDVDFQAKKFLEIENK